jgi:membrane-associated phospholipid phosphatase
VKASAHATSDGRPPHPDRWDVPVLVARPGGSAERFARRLRGSHPAAVFLAAVVAGFALLGLFAIAIGVLVTDLLLDAGGVARTEERTVRSLVAERTPFFTDASEVGSTLGGAPLLPVLVGAIALVCACLRKWRIAAFSAFALVVESATYRVTSLAVPRERPAVERLEDLPANASFPSGHTAAAVAVYAGLVLLITSRFPNRGLRVLAWAIAVLVPAFVALSRMYRGMHHPLDLAGGLVIGIGALLVLLFACRSAGVAHQARSLKKATPATSRRAQPVA